MATSPQTHGVNPQSPPTPRRLRSIVVLAGGVALLWITVAATLAQVGTRRAPALVLRAWPFAAGAMARAAEATLAQAGSAPDVLIAVRAQAAEALLREPVNVVAARVAGMAAVRADEQQSSRRLLAYAQHLSRRDLGTQVALIEQTSADNDIPAALHHFDTALRTGDTADQLLMPVLVTASRDAAISPPLATMLKRRPPWRLRFLYRLITTRPWASTFAPLVTAARLDAHDLQERDLLARAAKGLVAEGKLADAARLYVLGVRAPIAMGIRDGNFVMDDRVAPFDWDISDEPGLAAVEGRVDGAPFLGALSLNADAGRSGTVARQLLLLTPGRYQLRFTVGDVGSTDRSSVTLVCNSTDAPLAKVRFPATANRPRTIHTTFNIPAGCPGQWLAIHAATDIDAARSDVQSPWISGIAVTR